MASKFQKRLVGTIVLVSIGVIVLPDILDGKKTHYQEEFASIPIKPQLDSDVESFEMLEPEQDEISLPPSPVTELVQEEAAPSPASKPKPAVKTESEKAESDKAKPPKAEPPKNKPEKVKPEPVKLAKVEVAERNEYADTAWIIQLMALRNADNAANMVKDLQKRGYQAHTKKENGFTRVIIGPDVSKSKLERQIKELEKITGSKGQLLKFKPLNP